MSYTGLETAGIVAWVFISYYLVIYLFLYRFLLEGYLFGAYLGYIDVVGRQNIIDFNLGVTCKPTPKLGAKIAGHFLWRDEREDALYNAGGGVVRPGAPGTDREVGQEIDLTLTYRFDRHLIGELGYSHFFAGDFLEETGESDDIDFVYLQLQYTF